MKLIGSCTFYSSILLQTAGHSFTRFLRLVILLNVQYDIDGVNGELCAMCDDQVASVTDVSNFDIYPADNTVPPDDLTGWDKDF